MRLASKGLGKITLPLRFTEARISEAPDCIVLEGAIKESKVNWTYRAELEDSDILNFVILAHSPPLADYIAEHVGLALFGRALRAIAKLLRHPGALRGVKAQSVPDTEAARGAPESVIQ